LAPGRGREQHVHDDEGDSFHIFDGEIPFFFGAEMALAPQGTILLVPPETSHGFENERRVRARMLEVHVPAGFDRRTGLAG
jgi:mannose-6-phosphate isomerase-like protein (cupin superfamily)